MTAGNKFKLLVDQEITSEMNRDISCKQNLVHLEYIGANHLNKSGESNKFWMGWTEGNKFICQFGPLGKHGQVRVFDMMSPSSALQRLQEKSREKTRAGYMPVRKQKKG